MDLALAGDSTITRVFPLVFAVDFASAYWDDGVLSRRFNPDAVGRLTQKDKLSSFISSSAKWLLKAIGNDDTSQCSQGHEI